MKNLIPLRGYGQTVPLFAYLFILAVVGSLTLPIRAIFITDELGGTAFENGLTFALPAMIGMFVTPIIGDRSDSLADRRIIVSFGVIWIGLGSIATAFIDASWMIVVISVITFPLFSSVNAQYFAWAAERPTQDGKKNVDSGQLRIGYVAGWVLGPAACGWLLVMGLNYRELFMWQGIGLVAIAAAVWMFTANPYPDTKRNSEKFRWSKLDEVPADLRNIAMFVAFVLAGDILRLANMSLFVAQNISTDPKDLTIIYMATPIVELPAAMVFVWLAKRIGQKNVLGIGVVSGLIYFGLSPFASNMTQMVALQALYGLIPASVLTIGINYAQNCLPERMGFATSVLFAGQSLTILIGGALTAIGGAFMPVTQSYFLPLVFMVLSGFVWLHLKNR